MHIRKRTVSETETHRIVTVRGQSILASCSGCEQEVEIAAVECSEEFPGAGRANSVGDSPKAMNHPGSRRLPSKAKSTLCGKHTQEGKDHATEHE